MLFRIFFMSVAASYSLFAALDGIICRDDRRHEGSSLTELILVNNQDGYRLEWQYIASYGATEMEVKHLAHQLTCKVDKEAMLAFCENESGNKVFIHESRETFLDSLDEDKKKFMRYTDILVYEAETLAENLRFLASNCQSFGG